MRLIILVLGTISAVAPLAIDMYLPAFPALQKVFGGSGGRIQLTLASFFVAFAFGQAFYGPIADRFGRKPPLMAGMAIFVASSIWCALAGSIWELIAGRFLQAAGACAGMVIGRAVVSDLVESHEAAAIYSTLMLVVGMAPLLAPLIGGQLLVHWGWHAIFWFQTFFGIICLILVIRFMPETSRGKSRSGQMSIREIVIGYGNLFRNTYFLGCAMVGGLCLAGMFVYIAGSPFVFIELHHVSPGNFGFFFGANALGLTLASQLNRKLLRRYASRQVLAASILIQCLAGLALVGMAWVDVAGIWGIAIPLFIYLVCLGLVVPNSTAMAMAPFREQAGTASALMGTLQFLVAALASTIMSIIPATTATPMSGLIAVAGCGGLAILWRVFRRGNLADR